MRATGWDSRARRWLARARLHRPDARGAAVETGGASQRRRAPGESLRVATFNVHAEPPEVLVPAIRASPGIGGADVLLLQEVESIGAAPRSQARQLAELLELYFAYAPAYARWDGGSHGVAILSRYPLRDLEVLELPRFDVGLNSARRIALGATVSAGSDALRVYTVHLDNRINPRARLRQLEPLLERAGCDAGSVVVGGDFNTGPYRWLAHALPVVWAGQAARIDAAMRARGYATPAAGLGATSRWFGMRLDALFTRGVTPVAASVDRTVRVSDHLPVWVDVQRTAPCGGEDATSPP